MECIVRNLDLRNCHYRATWTDLFSVKRTPKLPKGFKLVQQILFQYTYKSYYRVLANPVAIWANRDGKAIQNSIDVTPPCPSLIKDLPGRLSVSICLVIVYLYVIVWKSIQFKVNSYWLEIIKCVVWKWRENVSMVNGRLTMFHPGPGNGPHDGPK